MRTKGENTEQQNNHGKQAKPSAERIVPSDSLDRLLFNN
jgi:hypothetical protein